MAEQELGSAALEKLTSAGVVSQFYEALASDDARTAAALLRSAGVDAATIASVLQRMAPGDDDH